MGWYEKNKPDLPRQSEIAFVPQLKKRGYRKSYPRTVESHWNIKEICGQRFKFLVVVEDSGKRFHREVLWKCLCDCGEYCEATGSALRLGKIVSCGHSRIRSVESRKNQAIAQIKPGSLLRKVYGAYKQQSRSRKLEFSISQSEFDEIVSRDCFYCGEPPMMEKKTKYESRFMNGLDRIDNSLGYTISNLVSCCTPCNLMKHARTKEEFLNLIWKIASHQGYIQEVSHSCN